MMGEENFFLDRQKTLVMVERQIDLPVNSKILVVLVSSMVSSTFSCTPNIRHCSKVQRKYMVQVVLGRYISFNYCTNIWSTREALGEYFKKTWVRVNQNPFMPFMSNITNEENKEGKSDIGMFEVQVCDVGTLQKPFLTILCHVNTFATRVI